MIWKRVILSWMTLLAIAFASSGATAAPDVSPKTHVGAIDLAVAICIEASGLASAEQHRGNWDAGTTETSDVPHAARGGAQSAANAARLRSQLAADHILNAQRVGSGLKADAAHRSASFLSRAQLEAGQVFGIRGGDGVQRTLLQTQGGMNGRNGIFEFIIDKGGSITHQRFIPGGAITGSPNQIVKLPP